MSEQRWFIDSLLDLQVSAEEPSAVEAADGPDKVNDYPGAR